jgi:hypothetical protein
MHGWRWWSDCFVNDTHKGITIPILVMLVLGLLVLDLLVFCRNKWVTLEFWVFLCNLIDILSLCVDNSGYSACAKYNRNWLDSVVQPGAQNRLGVCVTSSHRIVLLYMRLDSGHLVLRWETVAAVITPMFGELQHHNGWQADQPLTCSFLPLLLLPSARFWGCSAPPNKACAVTHLADSFHHRRTTVWGVGLVFSVSVIASWVGLSDIVLPCFLCGHLCNQWYVWFLTMGFMFNSEKALENQSFHLFGTLSSSSSSSSHCKQAFLWSQQGTPVKSFYVLFVRVLNVSDLNLWSITNARGNQPVRLCLWIRRWGVKGCCTNGRSHSWSLLTPEISLITGVSAFCWVQKNRSF